MFFDVKKISGKAYLYKLRSIRDDEGEPTHETEYVGSVRAIQKAIRNFKERGNGNE